MEIKVETNKESYIRSVKAFLIYAYKRHLLVIACLSVFLAAILVNQNNFDLKRFTTIAFYSFITLLLLSLISSFLKTYKKLKTSIKEIADKTYEQIFTLHEDGISINSVKVNCLCKWFEIKKIYLLPDYMCVMLRNKLIYAIPKSAFATPEDENIFLRSVRRGINEASKIKIQYPEPLYYWGFLGLIPIVGAVNGLIMIISGISKYKDFKYAVIGFAGILVTAIFFGSFLYYENGGSLTNGKFFRSGFINMSQMELNSLTKEVEFYKLQHGVYPDSLQQLAFTDESINIHDPLLDGKKNTVYNYHRIGNKYTLFSSGMDQIPNTADDIYPTVEMDTSKIGLIIKR